MKILRAHHLGMCFGVRDAIALADQHSSAAPLSILGELVHNETVLRGLRARGVALETDLGRVRTPRVMITAHGASERLKQQVRGRGLEMLEATCPLVSFAHRAVARLVGEGYHPVIIGRRGHVEVRGLTEDLEDFDIVLTEEDVDRLEERPRFGVAAQTTQPIERVRMLVERLRRRFPDSEVKFLDTVCQPTKQRQQAAVDLAKRCDVVIVIGGAHSNNTHELMQTCLRHCERVHKIQSAAELREEWFLPDDTVGITAGTSTPDSSIDEVERALRTFQLLTPVSAR
jgi:4-hydroxy-3-methylbut-2-en-1-yl diphosphate reductase